MACIVSISSVNQHDIVHNDCTVKVSRGMTGIQEAPGNQKSVNQVFAMYSGDSLP